MCVDFGDGDTQNPAGWTAESADRWIVPVGGGFGKIVKLGGKLPVNLQLSGYYNVVTPPPSAPNGNSAAKSPSSFRQGENEGEIFYGAIICVVGRVAPACRSKELIF